MDRSTYPISFLRVVTGVMLTSASAIVTAPDAAAVPIGDRQTGLNILHDSLETLWGERVEMTVDGVTYAGFATATNMDDGEPFWGDEVGACSDSPLWDFQNAAGSPGVLFAFVEAYHATGNAAYLRRAEALAETLMKCQDALGGGWFYDAAVINNEIRNVGIWGNWGDRMHDPADIQGWFSLDDSISQSCAHALLRLYQANEDPRVLAAVRRFADILVNLKDVQSNGAFPYRDGGIPQVLPISRARTTAYNQNQDVRSPDGPYMAHKTLNDDTTSSALIFLIELYLETNDARYRDAVRLNIDFLIDCFDANGGRGWAQQYHYLTDEIAWGRGKEPPAFVTCEHHIVEVMLHWYGFETDGTRRTEMRSVLEQYMAWLAGLDTPTGSSEETWRYYNHDAAVAPMDAIVFGNDFRRYFGVENESNAESGQPYRGRWDRRWVSRLTDGSGNFALVFEDWFMWKIPDRPLMLLPDAWEPSASRPNAVWIDTINLNGQSRAALVVSRTNERLLDLAWRIAELPGVVTDADADGFSDAEELAHNTDPRDADDVPGGVTLADMNCDGEVTVSDVSGFLLALLEVDEYAAEFPDCDMLAADVNGDGTVSISDIGGFVSVLLS